MNLIPFELRCLDNIDLALIATISISLIIYLENGTIFCQPDFQHTNLDNAN